MATISRGYTFSDGETLSPGTMNQLVDNAVLTDITSADLGSSLYFYNYGDSSPGLSAGQVWYDTTSGVEGLKISYLTPSNASISDWLYVMPRREAYFWAQTSCSMGQALFIGSPKHGYDAGLLVKSYDGAVMPYVTPLAADADATGLSPAVVVAMESRTGAGPVKAAWAGLIPVYMSSTSVFREDGIFLDPTSPAQWQSGKFNEWAKGLTAFWDFSEASGTTRADSVGSSHLIDAGGTPAAVGTATGKFTPLCAAFVSNVSARLSVPSNSAIQGNGHGLFAMGCWIYLENKDADQFIYEKWDTVGNNREYLLNYVQASDNMRVVISAGDAGSLQAHLNASNPPSQEWFFFFWDHDGDADELHTQLNDEAVTTNNPTGGIGPQGADLVIGVARAVPDRPLYGRINYLAIWKDRDLGSWRPRHLLYNFGNGAWPVKPASGPARSMISGLALRDSDDPSALTTDYLLWGGGPVCLDHEGTA